MNSRGQPRTTEEWFAVLKERDELKAALADMTLEKNLADARLIGLQNIWREKLAEAGQARERQYDCHGGPGMSEPFCGGCISCLNRALAEALRERDGALIERDALTIDLGKTREQVESLLRQLAAHIP